MLHISHTMHMTIPLNNLYHWVSSLAPQKVITYVFNPPGSRCISNLIPLEIYSNMEHNLCPEMICYDQEPLNFDLYKNINDEILKNMTSSLYDVGIDYLKKSNLRAALNQLSIYDQVILLHSEKQSDNLEKYKSAGYIDVYYWAHAVIAKDWFRFAKSDTRLTRSRDEQQKHLFLIYNRDWQGTREYRLKFAEMLYNNDLLKDCNTLLKKDIDPTTFSFSNIDLKPASFEFVNAYNHNTYDSHASADYIPEDFVNSTFSIVLETLFDDSRIHLTEKVLKSIACGHPFILAGTCGSLRYLRSYGFKTFSPWIDESYDDEPNSVARLQKIIQTMKQIQSMSLNSLRELTNAVYKVAEYNRNWFFSEEFDLMIQDELTVNLNSAVEQVKKTKGKMYLYRKHRKYPNKEKRQQKLQLLKNLRNQSC